MAAISFAFFILEIDQAHSQTYPNGENVEDAHFAHSAVYAEFLGQGLLYSVNYDYRISENLDLRVGFSSWSIPGFFLLIDGSLSFTGFPVMLNYLSGDGDSHFEVGAGFIPSSVSVSGHEIFFGSEVKGQSTEILGTATIGFRLQPRNGGFIFRIGFTPLMSSHSMQMFGGTSVGLGF